MIFVLTSYSFYILVLFIFIHFVEVMMAKSSTSFAPDTFNKSTYFSTTSTVNVNERYKSQRSMSGSTSTVHENESISSWCIPAIAVVILLILGIAISLALVKIFIKYRSKRNTAEDSEKGKKLLIDDLFHKIYVIVAWLIYSHIFFLK